MRKIFETGQPYADWNGHAGGRWPIASPALSPQALYRFKLIMYVTLCLFVVFGYLLFGPEGIDVIGKTL